MQNPIYFNNSPSIDKLDLQTCVLHYQSTRNPKVLEFILYKLRRTLYYYMYKKTRHPDKAELLAIYEDKLLECLDSYDPSRSRFITYYCKCLDNALINYIIKNRRMELSLDYEYDSEEDSENTLPQMIQYNDPELTKVEDDIFLEQIKPYLDDSEYKVCSIIVSKNYDMSYIEIADEMGMTLAAIPNILRRLKKKFKRGRVSEKFLNSL